MFSAVFALVFAFSLLPGRTPLCLVFARRISGGILPDGAYGYCRKLTWVWMIVLAACSAAGIFMVLAMPRAGIPASAAFSAMAVVSTFAVERRIRRSRFSVVFHTSGSSSDPKPVVKTFESLAREVAFHRSRLSIDPRSVFLSTVETGHMYGTLWRSMLPAAAGCRADPDVIFSPEALVAKMSAAEKVFFVTTPSFLKSFCAHAGDYPIPRNCVEVVTSGSLLDADTSAAARRVFGVVPLEIFGSTETGGVAWRRQEGGDGSPYDWRVFDPVKVGLGTAGRLKVWSPFSFRNGFEMGDGVELSPDRRRFRLLGRLDRTVKISELRISLPEMEALMRGLEGVSDAALVALEGDRGTYLGAVIAPASGEEGMDAQSGAERVLEMRRRLGAVFPRGTVPRRFRFVTELPRNAQGKVQVAALKAMFQEREPQRSFLCRTPAEI